MKVLLFLLIQISSIAINGQSPLFKIDTIIDDFNGIVSIGSQEIPFSNTSTNAIVDNALALKFFKTGNNFVIGLIVVSKELWQSSSENWVYFKLSSGEVLQRPVAFQIPPKYKEIEGWGNVWGTGVICVIKDTDFDIFSKTGIEKIRIETIGVTTIDFTVYSKAYQIDVLKVITNFKNNVVDR